MHEFLELMEEFQSHGGIVITIIFCFFMLGIVYSLMRNIDHFRINRKMEGIERRAVDRTYVHEIYWHRDDMDHDEYVALKKKLGLE